MEDEIMRKFENIHHDSDMVVSTNCISQIIAKLECDKSAGLSKGYLPTALIETTIVPIVNNKSANLSDSKNYGPIAIATIISKIVEFVLLIKYGEHLNSCDNQFCFKSSHSTGLCIYVKGIYELTH